MICDALIDTIDTLVDAQLATTMTAIFTAISDVVEYTIGPVRNPPVRTRAAAGRTGLPYRGQGTVSAHCPTRFADPFADPARHGLMAHVMIAVTGSTALACPDSAHVHDALMTHSAEHYDVFNGDADGLCALQQLRLANPERHGARARLITGPKRDVALLERVPPRAGDSVTVLDVSLEVNRAALLALLAAGMTVEYFDHHRAGAAVVHPAFTPHLDAAPRVCTGMLVDRHLHGRARAWAAVAAFGDNLQAEGRALAASLGLDGAAVALLEELGTCLNYNGYGDRLADLLVPPADLAERLRPHADPLAFARNDPTFPLLRAARAADLDEVAALRPSHDLACGRVFVLPDTPWSRRVRGEFGNQLAQGAPQTAHAVVAPNDRGGYVISVRAPLARMTGADRLCRQFEHGGGRPAAAGINHLATDRLEEFVAAFAAAFAS